MQPLHRRILPGLLAGLLLPWLGGCAAYYSAPIKPPTGILFTNVKAPLSTDFNETSVDRDSLEYAKGKTQFFWDILLTGLSFSWDVNSISRIAQEGGIEEVHYADYEVLNVLGIYAQSTVIVHGK